MKNIQWYEIQFTDGNNDLNICHSFGKTLKEAKGYVEMDFVVLKWNSIKKINLHS